MILELLGGALAVSFFGKKKENAKALPVNNLENWKKYDAMFEKYGRMYGVPWTWLKAIALNESNLGQEKSVAHGLLNPTDIEKSKSSDGLSWGLMQVTIKTARAIDGTATEAKLNNPEYSIKLAAQIVAQNMRAFNRSSPRYIEAVIKSYNQGPNHTKNELAGKISNPAWHDHVVQYWERFQRNLKLVKDKII
jgi:membrane-bound lytic murein transglycosylase MltF